MKQISKNLLIFGGLAAGSGGLNPEVQLPRPEAGQVS